MPELLIAVPLLLIGIGSAVRSLAEPFPADTGRSRLLAAIHDAAKAGFWLTLGGFFLIYGLVEEPFAWRWFALVPLAMAGLRLFTAMILARGD